MRSRWRSEFSIAEVEQKLLIDIIYRVSKARRRSEYPVRIFEAGSGRECCSRYDQPGPRRKALGRHEDIVDCALRAYPWCDSGVHDLLTDLQPYKA